MTKPIGSFFKGLGTGVAVGAVAGMIACSMSGSNQKSTKKKLRHAVKGVSDFMENLSYMIK